MRDLFILGFLGFLVIVSFKRPWLMTLAYIYVDLVQPQRISYYLLSSIPVSLIFALAAVVFWLTENRRLHISGLQLLLTAFLGWITATTLMSMLPEHAWIKWSAAWKAIAFGIFLPLVLTTERRIEAVLFTMVFCISSITISGGIKTLAGGGGYGTLRLLVDNNSGLYESSTIATVAIASITLILYLYRYNSIFKRNWLVKLMTAGLIFASLLIPIGTEARTGLIAMAVLGLFIFLSSRHKLRLAVAFAIVCAAAIPMLPKSFTERMSTIESHEEDQSASTRLAVWQWTLDFVKEHPLGGGFGAYRLNEGLKVETVGTIVTEDGVVKPVRTEVVYGARAFHSSWFEVLGEHGYPGLLLYVTILVTMSWQLWRVYRRYRRGSERERRLSEMAKAVLMAIAIYCAGSTFVGVAFQTTLYLLIGIGISIVQLAALRAQQAAGPEPAPRPVPLARPYRPIAGRPAS